MRENTTTLRRLVVGTVSVATGVASIITMSSAGVSDAAARPVPARTADTRAASTQVAGPVVRTATVVTTSARWAGAVDVSSRSTVAYAYKTRYGRYSKVLTGWTGSTSSCTPGTISSISRGATLSSLNFARSLNGLAPVRFSSTMNSRAQRTALLMAANNMLDHYPSSSWRCYTTVGGSTAARSNIALAYPTIESGQIVDLYLDDRGSSNEAVGHRRWLLYPFTTYMGNGSTSTANAITVIGPTSSLQPNPRYTSWPSRGYFPLPMEPGGRWSLSSGLRRESFANARVHVWKNGVALQVHKYAVENGYGMPTIAWQMPVDSNRVGVFTVRVSGITRPGVDHSYSHTYRVRIFNPGY